MAYGRAEHPTAGAIDSPSVTTADTVDVTSRGHDDGKKINVSPGHIADNTPACC
jgi:hypothetical protein